MLVENLMTPDPESCRPDSTLAEAAAVMWRRDCGVVPVTEEGGRVVGVVTDRDICMALSMRGQRAGDVRVSEVMSAGAVETCTPVDDVREALEAMKRRQVRRLPVVDSRGRLVGILSVSDVIRHTRKGKSKRRVSRRDTLSALKAICRPHGSAEAAEEDAPDEHYDEAAPAPSAEAARTEIAESAEATESATSDEGAGKGKRARAKGARKGAGKSARRKKSAREKGSEVESAGGGDEGADAGSKGTDAGSGGG